ncbi:MAG TPA: phenylalanine--tRNA ligase subunit beta, partial [Cryomorphaceae bacterium]|nr:phenylalanine--tRNA ligase subunit beta [Cryomorphaceae bacterium]
RITVEIRDEDGCGRYAGLLIEGLAVHPSPDWLKNRLRSIGLNPVNAVVDITNFVQHETGQPLHAFDADKIVGNKVIVDTLPEGTKFTTLDDEERTLHESDLMICNDKGGMCIAGVFGGIDSGVGNDTNRVFLESAWFNPVRVRKTAKRHGLNTDASFRFERGVDPEQTLYALRRAADLILEIAGGSISGPLIDEKKDTPKSVELDFSIAKLNKLTGLKLSAERVKEILDALDFEILGDANDELKLRVPTYRVDVTRDVDVVEEVLRIYGYNSVELPERMSLSVSIEKKPERSEVIQTLCTALVGRGFNEMMSNGLTRSDYILKVSESEYKNRLVPMLNPLSQELDVLRPTLVVSALETVAHNLNRQAERLRLFELGKSYSKSGEGFSESMCLSVVQVGSRFPENWNNPDGELEISDLFGNLNAVFEILGLEMKTGEELNHPFYQTPQSIVLGSKQIGTAGQVSQKALKVYGIKKPVWVAEINLDNCLKKVKHAAKQLTDLPKFPAVRRDLSLLLDEQVEFIEIERIARKKGGALVQEVGLFDVYEGKNLPTGKKSYAVSFILRDKNKTLSDKQIDQVMGQIQKELESSLGASLR